jgi:hypothetical protein
MKRIIEVPDGKRRLTEASIAQLLGLAMTDYLQLIHRPIQASTDEEGVVTEFYIHVSSGNNPRLLDKLDLDKSNFARFEPEKVYPLFE